MPRSILRIRDMGNEGLWRILHEASHMTDAQQRDTSLQGRTAALLLADVDAQIEEDALSFGASVRQLDGQSLRVASEQWRTDAASLAHFGPLYSRSADVCIVHGLPPKSLDVLAAHCDAPLLNGGNSMGHPCAALADLGFFRERTPELDTVRIAWVGGANGLAHSLIEAAIYVPFELFMALPEWGEPDHDMLGLALKAGAKIFLTREPHLALDAAHYVYTGTRPEAAQGQPLRAGLTLTQELLAHARPDALVLRGAAYAPAHAQEVEADDALQATRWDWRLRVQKTLLPEMIASP